MDENQHHLNADQRNEIVLQVDHFVRVLADRYGVTPNEVVETVRWVKERKASDDRLTNAARTALIGIVLSAILLALWEGVKMLSHR